MQRRLKGKDGFRAWLHLKPSSSRVEVRRADDMFLNPSTGKGPSVWNYCQSEEVESVPSLLLNRLTCLFQFRPRMLIICLDDVVQVRQDPQRIPPARSGLRIFLLAGLSGKDTVVTPYLSRIYMPAERIHTRRKRTYYATAYFVNLAFGNFCNFLCVLQVTDSDKEDPGRVYQAILAASLLPHRTFRSRLSHYALVFAVAGGIEGFHSCSCLTGRSNLYFEGHQSFL